MSDIRRVADRFVADYARLDPTFGTMAGLVDFDEHLTHYSPDAVQDRVDLVRRTHAEMQALVPVDERDRVAQAVVSERLARHIEAVETGVPFRNLSVSWSPLQGIRESFDVVRRESTDDWKRVANRMERVPAALDSLAAAYRHGASQGLLAGRTQVVACARQCRVWAGVEPGTSSYFQNLMDEYFGRPGWDRKVEDKLRRAADAAAYAYSRFASFLQEEYLPLTPEGADEGVGPERYAVATRRWLGADVDARALYEWGWEELERVTAETRSAAERILPGAAFRDVVRHLNDDHERVVHGAPSLRDWLQTLVQRTTEQLNGTHFDIPAPLQRLEVRLAPAGGSAAQYYLPPSDDFSRPGTYWYPTTGRTQFPMWKEITTAYHEGVPGHHLQSGYVKYLGDELTHFQRSLFLGGHGEAFFIAGHGEGWALYAEKLMDELGYFERDDYRFGRLCAELFRAARVVIDIGLHLGLSLPARSPHFSGEKWTPEIAKAFLLQHCAEDENFATSEIARYLGLPGQAVTYKAGEQAWLDVQTAARQRDGDAFDLKAFHSEALSLGPMGLDQLRVEFAPSPA